MLEPQGRQAHNGAENRTHPTGQQNHQRPEMGQQHMVAPQNPGKRRQGVSPHPHEGGMADGYQSGKSGQQVQAVYRHDGDQNAVDNQHVFVADLKHQRPDKQQHQKTGKNQPVDMRQKYALFGPVGGKKITRG